MLRGLFVATFLSAACAFEFFNTFRVSRSEICKSSEIDLMKAKAERWAIVDDLVCVKERDENPEWDARGYALDWITDRGISSKLLMGKKGSGGLVCNVKLTQPVHLKSIGSLVNLWNTGSGQRHQKLLFTFTVSGKKTVVVGQTSNLKRDYKLYEWMTAEDGSTAAIKLPFEDQQVTDFTVAITASPDSDSLNLSEFRLCAALTATGDAEAAKQIVAFKPPQLKESYVTKDYDKVYWNAHQDSGDINAAQLFQLKDEFLKDLEIKAANGAPSNVGLMWDRKATPLYTLTASSDSDAKNQPQVTISFKLAEAAITGNFELLMNGKCSVKGIRKNRKDFEEDTIAGSFSVNSLWRSYKTNGFNWEGMRSWAYSRHGYYSVELTIEASTGEECNIGELAFTLEPLEGTAMRAKIESGHYRGRSKAPWPTPWQSGWQGLSHATFTENGPWISAVCFECDTVSPDLGDYVQIVGAKEDLIGSKLFYEVNDKNITLTTFTESALTESEDGNCLWLVSKKTSYPGAIKCGGTCDFSRTALRRFFLMDVDGNPQAVFVNRPYKAEDTEIVQVRSDRNTEATAFSEEWKPNFYSQSCDVEGAEARKDDDTTAASSLSLLSGVAVVALMNMF